MAREIKLKTKTIKKKKYVYDYCKCPKCYTESPRRSKGKRELNDLGLEVPVVIEVTYSKHYCPICEEYFNAPIPIADPGSHFTVRVKEKVMGSIVQDGMPIERVSERMFRDFNVCVSPATIWSWIQQGGEKNPVAERVRAMGFGAV